MTPQIFKQIISNYPTWTIIDVAGLNAVTFYLNPLQVLVFQGSTKSQLPFTLEHIEGKLEIAYGNDKFTIVDFQLNKMIWVGDSGKMHLEIPLNTKEDIISFAITNKLVLEFYYEGYKRIVEPYTLGKHKDSGKITLCAYFIAGYSKSKDKPYWRLYCLDDITKIIILNQNFNPNRKDYNPKDSRMSRIICTA